MSKFLWFTTGLGVGGLAMLALVAAQQHERITTLLAELHDTKYLQQLGEDEIKRLQRLLDPRTFVRPGFGQPAHH